MANSANMNMPIPVVGTTLAPDWASDIVNSLNILDAHDHSTGNGTPISPSGIFINANLPFNGNSITTLKQAYFISQLSALTGINFISFIGGNLYVNDGSGNQIPITAAGGVAGSPGSIGSLVAPASATYSAGSKLFSWRADSGKAAAMDNGAVTIRETNVASAKGITLASPTALGADYQLTLLTGLPASTQLINVDSSGNLGTITYDNVGVGMSSVGAEAILTSASSTNTWVPTITASAGVVSSAIIVTAYYWKMGNVIFYTLNATFTLSLTATNILFTKPVVNNTLGFFNIGSGNSSAGFAIVDNNDDPSLAKVGSSASFTSGSNKSIIVSGFYPID